MANIIRFGGSSDTPSSNVNEVEFVEPYTYDSSYPGLFRKCVKRVVLRDAGFVSTSLRGLFQDQKWLEEVVFDSSFDTSFVTNMYGMFQNCVALTSANLDFDTSAVTNMGFMFYNCTNANLALNFDTSSVTSMASMFSGCENWVLDNIDFDTSHVTNMNNMFERCKNSNFILEHFDTSAVTDMASMFSNCPNSTFNLDFDTSAVTNMAYMFYNCTNTNLAFDFDTSAVTNMSYMFRNCKGSTFALNFDTSAVTNMYYMFADCDYNFVLDLDTGAVTNMSYMFYNCRNTTFMLDFDTSAVTNMSDMFYGCYPCYSLDLGTNQDSWDTSKVTNFYDVFGRFGEDVSSSKMVKIWIPSTFVASAATSSTNKPFYGSGRSASNGGVDIFTDATNASSQSWGTPKQDFIFHYNSTHQDFLDAEKTLTITFTSDLLGDTWTVTGGGESHTGTVDSTLTAKVVLQSLNTTYTVDSTNAYLPVQVTVGNEWLRPMSVSLSSSLVLSHIKWTVTKLRSAGNNIIQMSEFQLLDGSNNAYVWPSGTTVSINPVISYSSSESPAKIIDGNTATKYCGTGFSGSQDIIINTGSLIDPSVYTQYCYYTGNDAENRDPVSWTLSLGDGTTWVQVDSQTNATIPTSRRVMAGPWSLTMPSS